MKIFAYLYEKMIAWSGHPHAPYYLAGFSFMEASFFPIPPDAMLISMGLASPQRAWRYASITTTFSVLGGLLGYIIGYYGMSLIMPFLLASSYAGSYKAMVHWFEKDSLLVGIMASFTPFPYKIFTITAGGMHMALAPFIGGSIAGRGLRFFLLATLLYFAGAKIRHYLNRIVNWLGAALLLSLAIFYGLSYLRSHSYLGVN